MSPDPCDLRDDALDPSEPIDARQWAMHGLLRVHFEDPRARHKRVDTTLRRLGIDPDASRFAAPAHAAPSLLAPRARRRLRRRPRVTRLRWLWTSGVAAAVLFIAIVAYVTTLGPRHAMAGAYTELVAFNLAGTIGRLDLDALLAGDPIALAKVECAIDDDWATCAALRSALESGDQSVSNAFYHAWSRAYRGLRSLGRWDESIEQMYDLADHAARYHVPGAISPWPHIALMDVGETRLARGDLAGAREAFLDSLALREMDVETARASSKVATRFGVPPICLVPVYWRLSDLALAEGDLDAAWAWHRRCEPLLRDYFAAVCRASRIAVPEAADALVLFERFVPDEFRTPDPNGYQASWAIVENQYGGFLPAASLVVQIRAQTYRTARLMRLSGNLAGAELMLRRAWAVADYPSADDERLAFAIPLEFARLGILHERWADAASWLERARAGTAAVVVEGPESDLSKPRLAGAKLTELNLLAGLVAIKLGGSDGAEGAHAPVGAGAAAGRQLIDNALASVDALAAQLDVTQRARFLDQFRAWRELAKQWNSQGE